MRIESGKLLEKRAARNPRILVTGGTGFMGSHIAAALLRAGHRVTILARSSKRMPARDRVARLVDWFGLDEPARSRLAVVAGDILDPGWADAALSGAAGPVEAEEIVHCASNTSFAERKRPEIEAVNIDGLRNVLDFAVRSHCFFFHHVSTAFVAGKRFGLCSEEWIESGEFTNAYEETKARGEILARDVCRREGIRLNVYRPSIVYGDSRTGRSLRFNAVYYPVKAAVFLRDLFLADIRGRGGIKAAEMGIRVEGDGSVHMPLRIEVGSQGGLNLVPIDHCVEVFQALRDDCLEGGIFHIVNHRPKTIGEIIQYAERFFDLRGIEARGAEAFAARPRSGLETLYDSYLETYRPYMQDQRTYELRNSATVLEKRGLVCPDFDYDVFTRCMRFAIETDWGARLFPA
jgi:nucleoside-diphosphate-sugar epimerase